MDGISCKGAGCDFITSYFELNTDRKYKGIKIYMV